MRDGKVLLLRNDRGEWENEVATLPMPKGYLRSITTWYARLRG